MSINDEEPWITGKAISMESFARILELGEESEDEVSEGSSLKTTAVLVAEDSGLAVNKTSSSNSASVFITLKNLVFGKPCAPAQNAKKEVASKGDTSGSGSNHQGQ